MKQHLKHEAIPRHPRVRLGNQWSNGLYDPNIDSFGNVMAYHPDLKEMLIASNVIDLVPEVACFELSLEFIHHILNMDYGEKVCGQFEFCEEPMAVHLFSAEILEPFGLYREGEALGEGPEEGLQVQGEQLVRRQRKVEK